MIDDARDVGQRRAEARGVRNGAESAIENGVMAVGDERFAVLEAQHRLDAAIAECLRHRDDDLIEDLAKAIG